MGFVMPAKAFGWRALAETIWEDDMDDKLWRTFSFVDGSLISKQKIVYTENPDYEHIY